MEKQYLTHYLPEKYKQHWFIDIYNFEITVLQTIKTQSIVQRQKSLGNRKFYNCSIFSTTARVSGHQVSLAKRPRPSLHYYGKRKQLIFIIPLYSYQK